MSKLHSAHVQKAIENKHCVILFKLSKRGKGCPAALADALHDLGVARVLALKDRVLTQSVERIVELTFLDAWRACEGRIQPPAQLKRKGVDANEPALKAWESQIRTWGFNTVMWENSTVTAISFADGLPEVEALEALRLNGVQKLAFQDEAFNTALGAERASNRRSRPIFEELTTDKDVLQASRPHEATEGIAGILAELASGQPPANSKGPAAVAAVNNDFFNANPEEVEIARETSAAAAEALPKAFETLTPRERTVWCYRMDGMANKDIANLLSVSRPRITTLFKNAENKLALAVEPNR